MSEFELEVDREDRLLREARQRAFIGGQCDSWKGAHGHFQIVFDALARVGKSIQDIGVEPAAIRNTLEKAALAQARQNWQDACRQAETYDATISLRLMDECLALMLKQRADIGVTDAQVEEVRIKGLLRAAAASWKACQETREPEDLHRAAVAMDAFLRTAGKSRQDIGVQDEHVDELYRTWPMRRARFLWERVKDNRDSKDARTCLGNMDFLLVRFGLTRADIGLTDETVARELQTKIMR